MACRILHLIDSTTCGDALEMLAQIVAATGESTPVVHEIVAMGHRSTGEVARLAGLAPCNMQWISSMGWADPAGWRSLRKLICRVEPTHIHAWGTSAVAAASVSGFAGPRIATFADVPNPRHMRLLNMIDRGRGGWGGRGVIQRLVPAGSPWIWIGTSAFIVGHLVSHGLAVERVRCIRPGIVPPAETIHAAALKRQLGIAPGKGPVILLGGEGANARHDYGLWAAAILQQMMPQNRVIIREDPRGQPDVGLERFEWGDSLPEADMIVVAPADLPWQRLVYAADVLLISADGPVPTGSILAAMAAGVPVVGTPIDCITELITQGQTGLLAQDSGGAIKPRALASRIEELVSNPALCPVLTARAATDIAANFAPSAMLESLAALYSGEGVLQPA